MGFSWSGPRAQNIAQHPYTADDIHNTVSFLSARWRSQVPHIVGVSPLHPTRQYPYMHCEHERLRWKFRWRDRVNQKTRLGQPVSKAENSNRDLRNTETCQPISRDVPLEPDSEPDIWNPRSRRQSSSVSRYQRQRHQVSAGISDSAINSVGRCHHMSRKIKTFHPRKC
jgi:hypothetical protein